jgi:hypothetical protein
MNHAIKVNGDYEIQLFQGKQGLAIVNQSLEFLAFFLSDLPVLTHKIYSREYLDHVAAITGRFPETVKNGKALNWWGELHDLEHERWMNSKVTSMNLALREGWTKGQVLHGPEEAKNLVLEGDCLIKDAYGMSGMGLRKSTDLSAIKNFPIIVEPLLKRTSDFSHYVFPGGSKIAYRNFVDERFQYRGSLFNGYECPEMKDQLATIISYYTQRPLRMGFSVDSFFYEDCGESKLHILSEVNYRRTMGSTAWELIQKFGKGLAWQLFLLVKCDVLGPVSHIKGVLHLSPTDVRFQMFLLSASNAEEGREILEELKHSLPSGQFSVNV